MPRRLDLADLEAPLAELLARQEGLARRSQLRAHGVTRGHIAARIRSGRWAQVAPEVVSTDNGRLDLAQRRWVAVLHAPAAAWIGHLSSLQWRGLTGWERDDVHVLLPRCRRPPPLPGIVVHQSDRLPGSAPDLALGLPVVPAARATLDSASAQPHPRLAAALVVATIQQRIVTPDALAEEVEQAGRIRHKLVIREAVVSARSGAESLAEADLAPLIAQAGLPAPRRQVVIAGRPRDVVVDLPDATMLVIEVDGPQHDDPRARWIDSQRDAELVALGYAVLRIPAYAIRTEPARIVTQLAAIRRRAATSMGHQRTF